MGWFHEGDGDVQAADVRRRGAGMTMTGGGVSLDKEGDTKGATASAGDTKTALQDNVFIS